MSNRIVPFLMVCLMVGTAAHAQSGGGHGRGGRGGGSSGGSASTPAATSASAPRSLPMNQIEIVGVITAIDPGSDRVTIAYDAVEALNWPAGTMPFVVSKATLLTGAIVGEKVRFKLDSEQISDLKPF